MDTFRAGATQHYESLANRVSVLITAESPAAASYILDLPWQEGLPLARLGFPLTPLQFWSNPKMPA
jgi:hypothetical protein